MNVTKCALKALIMTLAMAVLPVLADDKLAAEVFRSSGVGDMIDRFPEMLKQGVSANVRENQRATDPFVQQLSAIIDAEINTKILSDKIQAHISQGLDEKQLSGVLEWLNSNTGKKIVNLEKSAISEESIRQMEKRVVDLQRQYKGSEREQLFNIFDKATNMTESSLDTAMAVQTALAGAFSDTSAANPATFEQLQQVVEANRFMTRGLIGQHVYTSYLYTYETLSTAELKQYIAFAESDAGKRYFQILNAAFRDVLIEPSKRIGQGIMRAALEDNS